MQNKYLNCRETDDSGNRRDRFEDHKARLIKCIPGDKYKTLNKGKDENDKTVFKDLKNFTLTPAQVELSNSPPGQLLSAAHNAVNDMDPFAGKDPKLLSNKEKLELINKMNERLSTESSHSMRLRNRIMG